MKFNWKLLTVTVMVFKCIFSSSLKHILGDSVQSVYLVNVEERDF